MKRILPTVFILIGLGCQAQINVKPGDKFIYNVEVGSDKYNFTIVVKSISPGFEFAYQMTNEAQTHGKVSMSAKAIQSANKMYNYFSGGEVSLKDMTSVLISRESFKQLSNKKTAVIYDDTQKYSFHNDGKDQFTYSRNGKSEQADGLYISDGNYIMTVLNDPRFPLIVSMDLGFSIKLSKYIPVGREPINLAPFIHRRLQGDSCKQIFSKVNQSSLIATEDLSQVGSDTSKDIRIAYYDYIEGLKVETTNDVVTNIVYYPMPLLQQERKYYGANFTITQVKDFLLTRMQQKKAIAAAFVAATAYDADRYKIAGGVTMELYYHVPLKGKNGLEFNGNGGKDPAKQKIAFVTFQ